MRAFLTGEGILFSVILCAYNSERFISRSIESVINQKYGKWELLIIDDGSTDKTGSISDAYAARDERISVYHQENAGKVRGWQKAVKLAKGEYICTVDADDWLDDDFLSYLFEQLSTYPVDIVCYEWDIHWPGKWDEKGNKAEFIENYYHRSDDFRVSSDEFLDFILVSSSHTDQKCFRKGIIQYTDYEKDILENRKIIFNTDMYQVFPIVCNSKDALLTCRGLAHYRVCEGSLSNNSDRLFDQVINILDTMEYISKILCERGRMNEKRQKLVYYEAMRQLYPRIRQIIRSRTVVSRKSDIRNHEFYKQIISFFGPIEIYRCCKDRELLPLSTLAYYQAFKLLMA